MKSTTKKFVTSMIYWSCGVAVVLGILWIISPSAGYFGLFLLSAALYFATALFSGVALGVLGVKLFFGNQVKEELLKKAGKWGGNLWGEWDKWDKRSEQTKEQEDPPRFIYLVSFASSVVFFYALVVGAILDWLVIESLFDALGIQHYICVPHDPHSFALSYWVSVVAVMATTIVLCGFSRDSWLKS